MTNAETISKLNSALTTLIKAYEEIKVENSELKGRISSLEDEVLDLEIRKEDLENSVNEFKSNTEEDKSNIYTMLGQIETILNIEDVNTKATSTSLQSFELEHKNSENIFDSQSVKEDDLKEEPNILNSYSNDTTKETEEVESSEEEQEEEKSSFSSFEDSNKIDLTDIRVSLLGINQ